MCVYGLSVFFIVILNVRFILQQWVPTLLLMFCLSIEKAPVGCHLSSHATTGRWKFLRTQSDKAKLVCNGRFAGGSFVGRRCCADAANRYGCGNGWLDVAVVAVVWRGFRWVLTAQESRRRRIFFGAGAALDPPSRREKGDSRVQREILPESCTQTYSSLSIFQQNFFHLSVGGGDQLFLLVSLILLSFCWFFFLSMSVSSLALGILERRL